MTLSDTQRQILAAAAQHEHRLAIAPRGLPAAARNAVFRSMLKHGLLAEITAPAEYAGLGWRQDEAVDWIALRLADGGLQAIREAAAKGSSEPSIETMTALPRSESPAAAMPNPVVWQRRNRRSPWRPYTGQGWTLVAEYSDIASGKDDRRPGFQAALARCRQLGAVLVAARLDRITRRAHTLSALLEEGYAIRAADMPGADDLMMRIYAAMAQKERELISERTQAALAAAKARARRWAATGATGRPAARTPPRPPWRVAGRRRGRRIG
ncbi:recombinase family protein [Siccirubricoccus deserti]